MIHFKGNTFAEGFLTAAGMGLAWSLFAGFRMEGGHHEASPSGKYHLRIMAPLSPTHAGTYTITLDSTATGQMLRSATVKLHSGEKTKALRGLPVAMNWDSAESCVDILIDGEFLIRMSVPAPGS